MIKINIKNSQIVDAFYPGGKKIDLEVEDTLDECNISAWISKEFANQILSCSHVIARWRGRDWIVGRPSTLFEGENTQWSIDLQVM